MDAITLKQIISAQLECSWITVEGDGRHWFATIVSPAFTGLRSIARHQRVYATLGGRMQTDEIHALSLQTYSPAEWEQKTNTPPHG